MVRRQIWSKADQAFLLRQRSKTPAAAEVGTIATPVNGDAADAEDDSAATLSPDGPGATDNQNDGESPEASSSRDVDALPDGEDVTAAVVAAADVIMAVIDQDEVSTSILPYQA